ncbi:glutathione transferase GstA [Achromobacter ruhlandii]|uniref:glutathione transferase GstA n=1 Tax=Achromobacter ruhlandii TaxID=72557 RepID=UPI0007BF5826|nr:glutathione transferase GstA [Achromobacter ruhlandii]MCV6798934.1 glutathione transferase GstA [Achromobacter ruhlandii]MCV6804882.1 glutathione transferase GstA [Achromobacter ruhlandii]MCV6810166.1 glutathione transferase GstA [Achromobacter ruhlandii]MCV6821504.1 glutathione transferase GstA [Achromobacter ruhlandii]MEB6663569.1 glutathione transferase GstA [Achromobacter ruhlandii]
MKLYYAPGTCSLSPHIVLRELGLSFDLARVDNRSKRTADGGDFLAINPKGYVAALQLDDGRVLTEGPAIVQYLADLRPEAGLVPAAGSWARSQLHEWLNFISAEIHGGFGPLFNRDLPEAARAWWQARLEKRLDYVAAALRERQALVQDRYGVADIYLYSVLRWAPQLDVDMTRWPVLMEFQRRVETRPAVRAALAAEAQG